MKFKCRHCFNKLNEPILDLGNQPPSNAYLTNEQLNQREVTYPLRLFVCEKCWLPQLPEYAKANDLFTEDYAYFSSTSSSWCNHAKIFVEDSVKRFNLDKSSFIVEIASNDGYLLQHVKNMQIPCLGIEPTKKTADQAEKKGVKTIRRFFGENLVSDLKNEKLIPEIGVDLLIANNVLAHVPNINDFMMGVSKILNKHGTCSIEFPHLLNLLKYNQFDTIYHEHYSYLSLSFLKRLTTQFELIIFDVQKISTHGGSLRVFMTLDKGKKISNNVTEILTEEKEFGMESLSPFKNLQSNSEIIKNNFLRFLLKAKEKNEIVCGYGAAAKANTLLNFSGVKSDLIKFIVDKSSSKQDKFMPGSLIPIYSQDALENNPINKIIVFPWNIIDEISKQLKNRELYTFIPSFKKW
tara:strand:+ start:5177 stop:6400 length:1224 start_codon:yes stop_codon:yes gene_type:complete